MLVQTFVASFIHSGIKSTQPECLKRMYACSAFSKTWHTSIESRQNILLITACWTFLQNALNIFNEHTGKHENEKMKALTSEMIPENAKWKTHMKFFFRFLKIHKLQQFCLSPCVPGNEFLRYGDILKVTGQRLDDCVRLADMERHTSLCHYLRIGSKVHPAFDGALLPGKTARA
jgi:hypothetical protein